MTHSHFTLPGRAWFPVALCLAISGLAITAMPHIEASLTQPASLMLADNMGREPICAGPPDMCVTTHRHIDQKSIVFLSGSYGR